MGACAPPSVSEAPPEARRAGTPEPLAPPGIAPSPDPAQDSASSDGDGDGDGGPSGRKGPAPAGARRLASGAFTLVGAPPEGTFVAVTAAPSGELRAYAGDGRLLAAFTDAADARLTAGEGLWFVSAAAGGTLSAWWPQRGSAPRALGAPAARGPDAWAVSDDGREVAFATHDAAGAPVVRHGARDGALAEVARGVFARFAPGTGALYVALDRVPNLAIASPHLVRAAQAFEPFCDRCRLLAFDRAGAHALVEHETDGGGGPRQDVVVSAAGPRPVTLGVAHAADGVFAASHGRFVPGASRVVVQLTGGAAGSRAIVYDWQSGAKTDGGCDGQSAWIEGAGATLLACGRCGGCACALDVLRSGVEVAGGAFGTLWSLRDDDRFALDAAARVAACAPAGPRRLTVGVPGGTRTLGDDTRGPVAWLDDATLLHLDGGGLARLDTATWTAQPVEAAVTDFVYDGAHRRVFFVIRGSGAADGLWVRDL